VLGIRSLPVATLIVVGRDAHGTMHVEAVARRREASLPALEIRIGVALVVSPVSTLTLAR